MKKHSLVAFEGIDGSGKATQVKMLAARLKKEGRTVKTYSFPRYEKPLGKLIKNALTGVYGDFHAMPAYYGSLPYSVDRGLASAEIRAALGEGIVVSDRYTTTNFAFGGALCKKSELAKFIQFFGQLEYRDFKLPKPDLVIYLAPSIKMTQSWLRKERGKKLDRNERDLAFQKKVADQYEALSKRPGWIKIVCEPGETSSEIHEKVWRLVRARVR